MDEQKNKKPNIQITELFGAKAGKDFSRFFYGTIKRSIDENGEPIVYGRIIVNDGVIYASGKDQWKMGNKLDELVLMILDFSLHQQTTKTTKIAEEDFFHS